MASQDIALRLRIDADTKELVLTRGEVNKLAQSMTKAESTVKNSFASIKKAVSGLAAAYVSFQSVNAFAGMIKGSIDAADSIGKMAERMAVSTEYLSGMQYAAGFAAVDIGKLNAATGAMTRRINNFKRDGGGAAKRALEELGITAEFARKNFTSTEKTFDYLLQRIGELPDGMEKTAIAQDLFSKSAADVVRVANLGAEKIAQYREEAERLGLVISQDMYDASAELNDRLDRMGKRFEGVGNKITRSMLPAMESAVGLMEDMLGIENQATINDLEKELGELGKTWMEWSGKDFSNNKRAEANRQRILKETQERIADVNEQLVELRDNEYEAARKREAEGTPSIIRNNDALEDAAKKIKDLSDAQKELMEGWYHDNSIVDPMQFAKQVWIPPKEVEEAAKNTFEDWGKTLNSSISNAIVDALQSGDVAGALQGLGASIGASFMQQGTASLIGSATQGLGMTGPWGAVAQVGIGLAASQIFGGNDGLSTQDEINKHLQEFSAELQNATKGLEALGNIGTAQLGEVELIQAEIDRIQGVIENNFYKYNFDLSIKKELDGKLKNVYDLLYDSLASTLEGFIDYGRMTDDKLMGLIGAKGYTTAPENGKAYYGMNNTVNDRGLLAWFDDFEDYLGDLAITAKQAGMDTEEGRVALEAYKDAIENTTINGENAYEVLQNFGGAFDVLNGRIEESAQLATEAAEAQAALNAQRNIEAATMYGLYDVVMGTNEAKKFEYQLALAELGIKADEIDSKEELAKRLMAEAEANSALAYQAWEAEGAIRAQAAATAFHNAIAEHGIFAGAVIGSTQAAQIMSEYVASKPDGVNTAAWQSIVNGWEAYNGTSFSDTNINDFTSGITETTEALEEFSTSLLDTVASSFASIASASRSFADSMFANNTSYSGGLYTSYLNTAESIAAQIASGSYTADDVSALESAVSSASKYGLDYFNNKTFANPYEANFQKAVAANRFLEIEALAQTESKTITDVVAELKNLQQSNTEQNDKLINISQRLLEAQEEIRLLQANGA